MKTKIEFAEQSKCVTAKVWIEDEDDRLSHQELLELTKKLFNEAQEYSKLKTMEKMK